MEVLKYPVGMQSFPEIRERGFVFVDKSMYIPMLHDHGKYFFLGRPRRFGKSLFLSMLHAFYDGRRELFDGLAADSYGHDWQPSPVLHIDFTGQDYTAGNVLAAVISDYFETWEQKYEVTEVKETPGLRFQKIIEKAYQTTGKKVVILIDEYDKPLLDTIELPELQESYRNQLRGIYGNLKKMDSYIQFAFLTGISRFGKLNIFSDLNNLKDISMLPKFSGICGITSEELHRYFHSGVVEFADTEGCSVEEMYEILRENYDGYHFSATGSPDVYNPFSLLNALQDNLIGKYWFQTGTPLFLVKRIKAQAFDLQRLKQIKVSASQIENVPFDMKGDPIPILYQTGYLTIKDYNPKTRAITLGFPNMEVEQGFLEQLLYVYTPDSPNQTEFSVIRFMEDADNGRPDDFMERLKVLFASISYDSFDMLNLEQHYQNVVYLLFKLLGYYCHAEYRTATGRIDMLLETERFVYVFEFKLNKSAREAIEQIDSKEYLLPFSLDGRQLFKIGANFSAADKNLDGWIIESAK